MVGMMLVRSYARGERILDAMRLRGYNGTFAFEGDLFYARRDAHFGALALAALALVAGLEWQ
jgi:energy-coupling factor transporter transmembrane protein EcfT